MKSAAHLSFAALLGGFTLLLCGVLWPGILLFGSGIVLAHKPFRRRNF